MIHMDSAIAVHRTGGSGLPEKDHIMQNAIIIAEKKNGSGFCKTAYICRDEADFVSRIRELTIQRRSHADIETASQAVEFLDETFGQTTLIITKEEFDSMTTDSWDTAVLEKAEELGWYEAPTEDDEE